MSDIESPIKVTADVSESTNETLKQLCLPAVKQVGKALGNVAGLLHTATLPIKLFNKYAEVNYQKYANKIKDIPIDKIKEVEPEIAIPLMEKLSYTSNNDLAEAYSNLLAKASNIDSVDLVHPGFINKINSMAPDEVRLLECLRSKNHIEYIIFKAQDEEFNSRTISYKLTGLEEILNLTANKIQLHIENLISLNILRDREGTFLINKKQYKNINEIYKDTKIKFENEVSNDKIYGENRKLVIEESFYEITTIGETFINACTDNKSIKL